MAVPAMKAGTKKIIHPVMAGADADYL